MNWKHLKIPLGNCNEFTTLSTRFDRSNDCCMDFAWKWNIQMNVFVALMNLSDSSRAGKLRLAQWDGPKLLSTGGRPEEVWPRRKILGIFFAPHFGCSTTGNLCSYPLVFKRIKLWSQSLKCNSLYIHSINSPRPYSVTVRSNQSGDGR